MPTRIPSSDLAAVILPVHHRLAFTPPTVQVARLAIADDLRDVARNRPPSSDLPRIVGRSPTHVIPAIPLKPAARILRTYPAVAPPRRQRLRRIDAEAVQLRI